MAASKKNDAPIAIKPTTAQLRERAAIERLMKSRSALPAWELVPMCGLVVNSRRHMLTLMILQMTPTAVNVTAVQALRPRVKKLTRRNVTGEIEKVFDDHAHDVVGTFARMSGRPSRLETRTPAHGARAAWRKRAAPARRSVMPADDVRAKRLALAQKLFVRAGCPTGAGDKEAASAYRQYVKLAVEHGFKIDEIAAGIAAAGASAKSWTIDDFMQAAVVGKQFLADPGRAEDGRCAARRRIGDRQGDCGTAGAEGEVTDIWTRPSGLVIRRVSGSVFRSAQPIKPEDWLFIKGTLGVTCVVKLNTESEGSELGGRILSLDVHELAIEPYTVGGVVQKIEGIFKKPDMARVEEALEVMAAGECLVHCEAGHDRHGPRLRPVPRALRRLVDGAGVGGGPVLGIPPRARWAGCCLVCRELSRSIDMKYAADELLATDRAVRVGLGVCDGQTIADRAREVLVAGGGWPWTRASERRGRCGADGAGVARNQGRSGSASLKGMTLALVNLPVCLGCDTIFVFDDASAAHLKAQTWQGDPLEYICRYGPEFKIAERDSLFRAGFRVLLAWHVPEPGWGSPPRSSGASTEPRRSPTRSPSGGSPEPIASSTWRASATQAPTRSRTWRLEATRCTLLAWAPSTTKGTRMA